jgi:hypothetical protein
MGFYDVFLVDIDADHGVDLMSYLPRHPPVTTPDLQHSGVLPVYKPFQPTRFPPFRITSYATHGFLLTFPRLNYG